MVCNPDSVAEEEVFDEVCCMNSGVVLKKKVPGAVKRKKTFFESPNIGVLTIALARGVKIFLHYY